MSSTTRSLGQNWTIKLHTGATCTACSADADAVRFTAGTCTIIGGCDAIDFGGSRDMLDVTSFEDTIGKMVPGRINLDPINLNGNYDGTCSTQKTLAGAILHEGTTAQSATVMVFNATDTVNKRKHSWKGYVNQFNVSVAVKDKATFAATILPNSKIQVCTTA